MSVIQTQSCPVPECRGGMVPSGRWTPAWPWLQTCDTCKGKGYIHLPKEKADAE